MEFIADTPALQTTIRSPGTPVLEVALGETVTLRAPVASVELRSAPDGGEPEIDGLSIMPTALGLHRFAVTDALGGRCDLLIFAFDPACIDRVPARQRSGRIGEDRSLPERRRVIRSIVQHHDSDARWFDGSPASMDNQPVELFGA